MRNKFFPLFCILLFLVLMLSSFSYAVDCWSRGTDDLREQTSTISHQLYLYTGINGNAVARAFIKFQDAWNNCTTPITVTNCTVMLYAQAEYCDTGQCDKYAHTFYQVTMNWTQSSWGVLLANYSTGLRGNRSVDVTAGLWYNFTINNSVCQEWLTNSGNNTGLLMRNIVGEGAGSNDNEVVWGAEPQNITKAPRLYISGDVILISPVHAAMPYFLDIKTWNNMTFLTQNKPFIPAVVHGNSSINFTSSNCFFKAENISAMFYSGTTNYTFSDTTSSYSTVITEGNTSLLADNIIFDVCGLDASKSDISIYINNSLFRTISSTIIPTCPNTHEEFNITSRMKNGTSWNISVRCDSCNVNKRMSLIYSSNESPTLIIKRNFLTHEENMTYNASILKYAYSSYPYSFFENKKNMTYVCNNSNTSMVESLGSIAPILQFVSINNMIFVNGSSYQINTSVNIIAEASGIPISFVSLNASYNNGTLVKSSNTDSLTLTNIDIGVAGVYNLTFYAKDVYGNSSRITGWLTFNDTARPTSSWISPNKDNSTTFKTGEDNQFNISIADENLWGYQVNVLMNNGSLLHNETVTGIITAVYSINFLKIFSASGKYKVKLWVWDSHTTEEIPDITNKASLEMINFDFKIIESGKRIKTESVNISMMAGVKVQSKPIITKGIDRYYFAIPLDNTDARDFIEPFIELNLKCSGLYAVESKYLSHFVCFDSRSWIDFQNPSVTSYERTLQNDGSYNIKLWYSGKEDILNFSSIGIINELFEETTFTVSSSSAGNVYNLSGFASGVFNTDGLNTSSTSGIMYYILFIIFIAFIIFLCEITRIPVLPLLAGVLMFFYGLMLCFGISIIIGIIFMVCGISYGLGRMFSFMK